MMVAATMQPWLDIAPPPPSVQDWVRRNNALGHMGLTERTSLPGTQCGYYAEQPGVTIIPEAEWDQWVEEIDWEQRGNQIAVVNTLDQDGIGSCGSESGGSVLYATRQEMGLPFVQFNPWSVYGRDEISGGRDQGSNIGDNLVYYRDYGVAPEILHPRSKGWRAKLSEEALEVRKQFRIGEFSEARSLEELGSAVIMGHNVMGGYSGHAICYYGLEKKGGVWYVLYRNSWGSGWNGNGRGSLRMNQVYIPYGLYVVRTAVESTWLPEGHLANAV